MTGHIIIYKMRRYNIKRPDQALGNAIQSRIDSLNKPLHSLGRLESVAMQVCLIEQRLRPTLHRPRHILLGGDHGIEREGVSVSPRDVTWQQMINFSRGGGAVNMFCRQHGFGLRVVDVGIDHDLSGCTGIENRKIAYGTKNFLHEPAMSEAEFDRAILTGEELADDCLNDGSDIICIGEMGIANTSASSVWMSVIGNLPLSACVGSGAGLCDKGTARKQKILEDAVCKYNGWKEHKTVADCMRYFGGFEMVAAVGMMLRAAECRLIIMIDGFIMTACALAAIKICPEAKDYMIFGHRSDEKGHSRLLDLIGAEPILNLGMRLGEGTGALCAFPIVDSAVRMMNEMNDFEHANITKYF